MLQMWYSLPRKARWYIGVGVASVSMFTVIALDAIGVTVPAWLAVLALVIAVAGMGVAYAAQSEA